MSIPKTAIPANIIGMKVKSGMSLLRAGSKLPYFLYSSLNKTLFKHRSRGPRIGPKASSNHLVCPLAALSISQDLVYVKYAHASGNSEKKITHKDGIVRLSDCTILSHSLHLQLPTLMKQAETLAQKPLVIILSKQGHLLILFKHLLIHGHLHLHLRLQHFRLGVSSSFF